MSVSSAKKKCERPLLHSSLFLISYHFQTSCQILRLFMGLSIKYLRKIFRKNNIANPLIRARKCAYQEVRNVSLSENLA